VIREVTSLLAGHLAAGSLFVTAALALSNRLPIGFLRFCTASIAGAAFFAAAASTDSGRFTWAVTAVAALVWYGALGRGRGAAGALAWLSAACAIASPALLALLSGGPTPWLNLAGSLSSATLMGAVTVTMILGHWYLVDTSLSIAPLRDGALWLWIGVLARVSAVLAVLFFGGWEILRVNRFADIVFSTNGLFFFFRSLMGLGAPLLLAGLIWQTVKIRSTQSATGLLYVALILVLFGELVSQFLWVTTGYPL
jgi:hypothetical protein